MRSFLSKHKFEAHLVAFTLMILTSFGLYLAIKFSLNSLFWGLLGGFVLANLLAIFVK